MPRSSHEEFYAQSFIRLLCFLQSPPGGAASSLPDSSPYGQRGRCPSRVAKFCAKLLAGCIVFCDSDSCAKHKGLWERLNPARSSLRMVWLNPARSSESKFQETIVPRVIRVSHVPPHHRQSAKHKGFLPRHLQSAKHLSRRALCLELHAHCRHAHKAELCKGIIIETFGLDLCLVEFELGPHVLLR